MAETQHSTHGPTVIAIDGPAGAGKSAVGAAVAARLAYLYFDTGVLYRALTWQALRAGVDPGDADGLVALATAAPAAVYPPTVADGRQYTVEIAGEDVTWALRSPAVDANVSRVSAHGAVRDILVAQQRRIAAAGRVVMVGRDIGTVVLPDAPLKVYLDAAVEARAERRLKEQAAQGLAPSYTTLLEEIRRRDAIDSGRAVAPLRPAADAVIIDTTAMTIAQVVERVLALAEQRAAAGEGRMIGQD
ncbi:MAG: (d)CMP kinase [Anaerolineae bacterium]